MRDSQFIFTCHVARGGYRWAVCAPDQPLPSARPGEERFREVFRRQGEPIPVLTDGLPLQVSGRDTRLSAPLTQETGLFRTLANTRPDREGVCQFASRFGLLGIDAVPVEVPFADRPDVGTFGTGELFTGWQAEIAAMREVLELLDLTQRRDTAALATRVRWTDDGVFYQGDTKPHVISSSPTRFLAGDLIGPAVHYVHRLINDRLEQLVSPRLLVDPSTGTSDLYDVPGSQLGAVWLQVAGSVREGREFRQCRQCQTWFEVSVEAARKSRLYCSPTCRTKGHRGRQQEARRLHAAGMAVERIADALDTTTARINTWLRGHTPHARR